MKKLVLASAVALACTGFNAQADIRFNGFASIVAGTALDEDSSLYGYDDNLSFKPESLFALQVSSDLGDGLSATAQILSRGENDFTTDFEWAYVSYELTDQTQVNMGRMRIPFYRYSDFLDVGYAYSWIRPPQSVYRMVFSTYDGVSVLHNSYFGGFDSTLQVITGSYEGGINLLSDYDPSKLESMVGVNWTIGNEWVTARAVYMTADTTISFENNPDPEQTLNQGIALFGATFPDAANGLRVENDTGTFFGLGATFTYDNWVLDMEVTNVEVDDSIVATQEQYYVSLGYRHNEYLFYGTMEHSEDNNDDNYSADLPQVLNVPGIGTVYPQATYQALLNSQTEEKDGFSIGMKYDFHPAAAFKVQYTSIDNVITNVTTDVLSVGVNMVF
jgi:hypothetical protein